MDAAQIMDIITDNNQYQTYKILEDKLGAIREEFKTRMIGDEMRRMFASQDVVCKYIRNGVYNVDQIALNQFLNDYGLLAKAARFETKDESLSNFKNEQTYYLRINMKVVNENTYDFKGFSDIELAQEWKNTHDEYKTLERIVEEARQKMTKCEKLKKEGKLVFSNGSLSLCKNKITYNVQAIIEEKGMDFVIQNAKTSGAIVDYYMEQGFFSQKEVDQFYTLVDMKLKFTVMTLSDEQAIRNMLTNKAMRASLNRELGVA